MQRERRGCVSVSSNTSCACAFCMQSCTNNRWGSFSDLLFNGGKSSTSLSLPIMWSCLTRARLRRCCSRERKKRKKRCRPVFRHGLQYQQSITFHSNSPITLVIYTEQFTKPALLPVFHSRHIQMSNIVTALYNL